MAKDLHKHTWYESCTLSFASLHIVYQAFIMQSQVTKTQLGRLQMSKTQMLQHYIVHCIPNGDHCSSTKFVSFKQCKEEKPHHELHCAIAPTQMTIAPPPCLDPHPTTLLKWIFCTQDFKSYHKQLSNINTP